MKPVRRLTKMSAMKNRSTRKFAHHHVMKLGHSARGSTAPDCSGPRRHIELAISVSKAISSGTAMPQ